MKYTKAWQGKYFISGGNKVFVKKVGAVWKSWESRLNFLAVELGAASPDTPGVTGAGIAYRSMSIPGIGKLSAPWNQDFLVLKAGAKLICPFVLPIDLKAHRGDFVRAVYSQYDQASSPPDLPLVRGRVFSKEIQLK